MIFVELDTDPNNVVKIPNKNKIGDLEELLEHCKKKF